MVQKPITLKEALILCTTPRTLESHWSAVVSKGSSTRVRRLNTIRCLTCISRWFPQQLKIHTNSLWSMSLASMIQLWMHMNMFLQTQDSILTFLRIRTNQPPMLPKQYWKMQKTSLTLPLLQQTVGHMNSMFIPLQMSMNLMRIFSSPNSISTEIIRPILSLKFPSLLRISRGMF